MMQSMRLTNSGEKRLRTAPNPMPWSLLVRSTRSAGRTDWNPNSGLISRIISREPRLLVRNTRLFSKFTVELSPRRRTPLSSTPSSRRVMEGAAFSISSNSTRERLHFSLVTAFHLENVFLAAMEYFGKRFDGLGLTCAGRSEQEKHPHRAALGGQAGLE